MKVTNKMSTITLHQGKSSKTISYESEILNYVYYIRALGNAVTSNELYLNYEVSMRSTEKNLGVHFKNGDIALWKDIFLLSEEILIFLKNFRELFWQNSKFFFL